MEPYSRRKVQRAFEKAAAKPPVINRTTVIKTEEMIAKEFRVWGGSLMGLGAFYVRPWCGSLEERTFFNRTVGSR